ncbi:hypothetical protein AKG16_17425 [Morganella morganii]|nr:hypothetical protein AKG16_17425 [Morganella morganii]
MSKFIHTVNKELPKAINKAINSDNQDLKVENIITDYIIIYIECIKTVTFDFYPHSLLRDAYEFT